MYHLNKNQGSRIFLKISQLNFNLKIIFMSEKYIRGTSRFHIYL